MRAGTGIVTRIFLSGACALAGAADVIAIARTTTARRMPTMQTSPYCPEILRHATYGQQDMPIERKHCPNKPPPAAAFMDPSSGRVIVSLGIDGVKLWGSNNRCPCRKPNTTGEQQRIG